MKKVFCMVMALVLLLPINSLGFEGRVDDDGDVCRCLHVNTSPVRVISTSYSQLNSTQHVVYATKERECDNCGATVYVNTSYQEPHSYRESGSCNGSTTTVSTICRYCNYISNTTSYPCKGANCAYPHNAINGASTIAFCCNHRHSRD